MHIHIQNNSSRDLREVEKLIEKFYPYAKEQLGFDRDANIVFETDLQNASDPLGNTAWYQPEYDSITVFVDNRHSKDILKSVAHELVHHAQNCRGDFENELQTGDGYAQKNPHLREMEREAYERGCLMFRDWTDALKENSQRSDKKMSINESKIRKAVKKALTKFDTNKLKEAYNWVDEKHREEKPGKRKDSGAAVPAATWEEHKNIEELREPMISGEDAVRMNEIKPFVMIGGKTYLWEESDGTSLSVSDPDGSTDERFSFSLSDIEDMKVPENVSTINESASEPLPLNEWYNGSLYGNLLKEYTE